MRTGLGILLWTTTDQFHARQRTHVELIATSGLMEDVYQSMHFMPARSLRPIDSSFAHSANHLFGSLRSGASFCMQSAQWPETTLSEKVSCPLSSTTLRQALKREPVSSVSIQHVRRSSSPASLSTTGSILPASLSESTGPERPIPKSHLSRTACLPRLDVPSFSKFRPRSSPTFLKGDETHEKTATTETAMTNRRQH